MAILSTMIKGVTRLGTVVKSLQGMVHIRSAKKSQGASLALDACDANGTRTTYFLYFSSDGKLRTGSSASNTEAGTVVGTQT